MRIEFLSNGQPNHSNWSIRTSFTEQKRCLAGLTFRHFFEGFCSEIFRCTENCPILALGYGMRNPNPPGLSCWGIRVKGFSNGIPKGPKALWFHVGGSPSHAAASWGIRIPKNQFLENKIWMKSRQTKKKIGSQLNSGIPTPRSVSAKLPYVAEPRRVHTKLRQGLAA